MIPINKTVTLALLVLTLATTAYCTVNCKAGTTPETMIEQKCAKCMGVKRPFAYMASCATEEGCELEGENICCCAWNGCNIDMATCKSGSVKQYGSFLPIALFVGIPILAAASY